MPNSFFLTYPAEEFDLARCVQSGQTFRWRQLPDDTWLGVDGQDWFVVTIRASGSLSTGKDAAARGCDRPGVRESDVLDFSVSSSGKESDFSQRFRLDWDAKEIERRIASVGPELRPYLGCLRGLRIMRQSDPYEVLFSFLCTPNNNIRRITGMVRSLAQYGEQIYELGGEVLYRFPPPERVAAIPEEDLRAKGFGWRARTIPAAARALLAKPDGWLESLKEASYEGAHAELCSIPGIGPKLADCIALFGLHHMEAVPIDTHMWQVACRLYFPEWRGTPLTAARYRQFGDFFRGRFGELAGWAHQYLFFDNVLNWRARKKDGGNAG